MRKIFFRFFLKQAVSALLLSIPFLTGSAPAQTYLDNAGNPTFTTAYPVEGGFINIANGNLHIEIPVASYPQRGKLGFTGKFVYDSRIWKVVTIGGSSSWQPTVIPGSQGGWRFITTGDIGTVSYKNAGGVCKIEGEFGWGWYPYTKHVGFNWTDPYGTTHNFPGTTIEPGEYCGIDEPTFTSMATDGSGYRMIVSNYTQAVVHAPDGTQVYPVVKDTNGNFFSKDANGDTIDTRNQKPIIRLVDPPGSNTTKYQFLKVGGGRSDVTVV